MTAVLEAPEHVTPAASLDQLKRKLAKADADLDRCDQQIAAAKADADQAYAAKDAAALGKLFARIEALERQRSDYQADGDRLADAIRAACQPALDAIAEEARATVAQWQADQDAAIRAANEHAAALAQAIDSLRGLPTWTGYGAMLGSWKARLCAVEEEAGVRLDLPALPDAVALPTGELGRALDAIRPLTVERGKLLPDRVWR